MVRGSVRGKTESPTYHGYIKIISIPHKQATSWLSCPSQLLFYLVYNWKYIPAYIHSYGCEKVVDLSFKLCISIPTILPKIPYPIVKVHEGNEIQLVTCYFSENIRTSLDGRFVQFSFTIDSNTLANNAITLAEKRWLNTIEVDTLMYIVTRANWLSSLRASLYFQYFGYV